MSLLLDSNALLWWLDAVRLPANIVRRIEGEGPVFVSVVTPWELWIKAEQGRLTMPASLEDRLASDHIRVIEPTLDDARLAARLPAIHRDPFDRMIIAQALNRRATIVTGDAHFAAYGVDVILV